MNFKLCNELFRSKAKLYICANVLKSISELEFTGFQAQQKFFSKVTEFLTIKKIIKKYQSNIISIKYL